MYRLYGEDRRGTPTCQRTEDGDAGSYRRARDLAEMRRCVADNKRNPRRFLQGKVFGVRPVGTGSAVVEVTRGTLRVMIQAEDFFHFSQMKGIENDDEATRQRRYLRKAKLMNGAIINFCPYMEA